MSSLPYFSSGIYPGHFGIKTTRELVVYVLPPSTSSILEIHPEEDVPAQDQLDDWENVEGIIKACPFLISSELALKKLKNSLPENTIVDLQLLPMPTSGWRDLPIGKTRVISRAGLPMSTIERARATIQTSSSSVSLHQSRLGRDYLCLQMGRT